MRILCIATKPPWPPRDGGRLALMTTIHALVAAGHELRVVAPREPGSAAFDLRPPIDMATVESAPRGWASSALSGWLRGSSASLARHRHPLLVARVAAEVAAWRPDVVHVEQLQALSSAEPARAAGIPVVLRMQNVESSLLEQAVALRAIDAMHGPGGAMVRAIVSREASRLRRDETAAIRSATRVIALSSFDAQCLREHGTAATRVDAIALTFPAELDAGPALKASTSDDASIDMAAAPPVAIGGSGWWPNIDGVRWLLREVLPAARGALEPADLHLFGGRRIDDSAVIRHPSPDDSAVAFPAGAIVAVPLRAGSGIRMRILEAFARGNPVVATTVAARGLDVANERELLVADTPSGFAAALIRLRGNPAMRQKLVANARDYLRVHHGQAAVDALVACYDAARR